MRKDITEKIIGIYSEFIEFETRLQNLELSMGHKYSPDQPRVPAGNPDGGQWTSGGGGGSGSQPQNPTYQGAPDLPLEPVYPLEGALGVLVGAELLGGLGAAEAVVGDGAAGAEGALPLPKPEGIPSDWKAVASNNGKGVKYIDHANPSGGTYVRTSVGNPDSSFPNSQEPYVRWQVNGQSLDASGNPVLKNTSDAHIPLTDFKFNPEVLK